MGRHIGRSGSCSSRNCLYKSRSELPSVQQLIETGSKIDRLYYGKYLPLRERKLLGKLIRTRAVYDDVRTQLLSGSGSSEQTCNNQEDDSTERSSAVVEIVDLVDRGQIGSASTCCSCCCSCSSMKNIPIEQPRVHRHNVPHEVIEKYNLEAKRKGRARRKRLSTKISSKLRAVRSKAKRVRSAPSACACPPDISSVNQPLSKRRLQKSQSKEVSTITTEEPKKTMQADHKASKLVKCLCNLKLIKQPMKSSHKIKPTTMSSEPEGRTRKGFPIKKDSLSLFRARLKKKAALEEWKCDPAVCEADECVPEDCYKKLKARRVGRKRIKKYPNKSSGTDLSQSHVSINTRKKVSNVNVGKRVKKMNIHCMCPRKTTTSETSSEVKRKIKFKNKEPSVIGEYVPLQAEKKKSKGKQTKKRSKVQMGAHCDCPPIEASPDGIQPAQSSASQTSKPIYDKSIVMQESISHAKKQQKKQSKVKAVSACDCPPVEISPEVDQSEEEPKSEICQEASRQVVRVGSTFSFNIEFYKDKSSDDKCPDACESDIMREDLYECSPCITKQRCRRIKHKHRSSQSISSGSKKAHLSHSLKRCICTLKIPNRMQKPYRSTSTSLKFQNVDVVGQMRETQTKPFKHQAANIAYVTPPLTSKPYEYEQFFCTPEECDPYECEKKKKARNCNKINYLCKDTNKLCKPKRSEVNLSSQYCSSLKPRKRKCPQSCGSEKSELSSPRSNRQSLRIGSSFSFNIEFSKNRFLYGPDYNEIQRTCQEQPRIKKKHCRQKGRSVHKPITPQTMKTEETKQTHTKKGRHKCICPTNILKEKSTVTPSEYCQDSSILMRHQCIATEKENMKGYRNRANLSPYEFEPSECSPDKCDKRIKKMIAKSLRCSGANPCIRSSKSGQSHNTNEWEYSPDKCDKRIKKMIAKSLRCSGANPYICSSKSGQSHNTNEWECGPNKCDKRNKQRIAKRRRCPGANPYCSSKSGQSHSTNQCGSTKCTRRNEKNLNITPCPSVKQVVRIGSNFSFNVEFYKERKQVCESTPIEDTCDRSCKKTRRRKETCMQELKTCVHQASSNSEPRVKEKVTVSSAIKRCFCTLKFNKNGKHSNIHKEGNLTKRASKHRRIGKRELASDIDNSTKIILKPKYCRADVCEHDECCKEHKHRHKKPFKHHQTDADNNLMYEKSPSKKYNQQQPLSPTEGEKIIKHEAPTSRKSKKNKKAEQKTRYISQQPLSSTEADYNIRHVAPNQQKYNQINIVEERIIQRPQNRNQFYTYEEEIVQTRGGHTGGQSIRLGSFLDFNVQFSKERGCQNRCCKKVKHIPKKKVKPTKQPAKVKTKEPKVIKVKEPKVKKVKQPKVKKVKQPKVKKVKQPKVKKVKQPKVKKVKQPKIKKVKIPKVKKVKQPLNLGLKLRNAMGAFKRRMIEIKEKLIPKRSEYIMVKLKKPQAGETATINIPLTAGYCQVIRDVDLAKKANLHKYDQYESDYLKIMRKKGEKQQYARHSSTKKIHQYSRTKLFSNDYLLENKYPSYRISSVKQHLKLAERSRDTIFSDYYMRNSSSTQCSRYGSSIGFGIQSRVDTHKIKTLYQIRDHKHTNFNDSQAIKSPFQRSYCAFNVAVPNKRIHARTLEEFKCKPGFSVPCERDPIKYLERMNSRSKPTNSSETNRLKNKYVTSSTEAKFCTKFRTAQFNRSVIPKHKSEMEKSGNNDSVKNVTIKKTRDKAQGQSKCKSHSDANITNPKTQDAKGGTAMLERYFSTFKLKKRGPKMGDNSQKPTKSHKVTSEKRKNKGCAFSTLVENKCDENTCPDYEASKQEKYIKHRRKRSKNTKVYKGRHEMSIKSDTPMKGSAKGGKRLTRSFVYELHSCDSVRLDPHLKIQKQNAKSLNSDSKPTPATDNKAEIVDTTTALKGRLSLTQRFVCAVTHGIEYDKKDLIKQPCGPCNLKTSKSRKSKLKTKLETDNFDHNKQTDIETAMSPPKKALREGRSGIKSKREIAADHDEIDNQSDILSCKCFSKQGNKGKDKSLVKKGQANEAGGDISPLNKDTKCTTKTTKSKKSKRKLTDTKTSDHQEIFSHDASTETQNQTPKNIVKIKKQHIKKSKKGINAGVDDSQQMLSGNNTVETDKKTKSKDKHTSTKPPKNVNQSKPLKERAKLVKTELHGYSLEIDGKNTKTNPKKRKSKKTMKQDDKLKTDASYHGLYPCICPDKAVIKKPNKIEKTCPMCKHCKDKEPLMECILGHVHRHTVCLMDRINKVIATIRTKCGQRKEEAPPEIPVLEMIVNKGDMSIMNKDEIVDKVKRARDGDGGDGRHEQPKMTPSFEMMIDKSDVSFMNTDETRKKIMANAKLKETPHSTRMQSKSFKNEIPRKPSVKGTKSERKVLSFQIHGKRRWKKDRQPKAGLMDGMPAYSKKKTTKIVPCICGSDQCKTELMQAEQDRLEELKRAQKKPCVCGSKICVKETKKSAKAAVSKKKREKKKGKKKGKKKVPPKPACKIIDLTAVSSLMRGEISCHDFKYKIRGKTESAQQKRDRENKIKNAKAEVERKKRNKTYAIEDTKRRKARVKLDKLAMKDVKRYKNTPECLLCAESVLDVGKLGFSAISGILRTTYRAVRDPKSSVTSIKELMKDPDRAFKSVKATIAGSGLVGTASRIKRRIGAMSKTTDLFDILESNPLTNYAVHFADKDPKKRLAKPKPKKRVREPLDFQCSLFMGSLRKRPHLWVYYMCPWFYPHCISLVGIWRQFTDVILFLLAVAVWSPCIFAMEACRALMCCFLCTG